MKLSILLVFFAQLFCTAYAEEINIKGKIKNENGETVPFAVVQIKKGEATYNIQASPEGTFSLNVKEKGIYTVTISFLNHTTLVQKLNVTTDITTNFQLKTEAQELDEVVIHGDSDPYGIKPKKSVEEGFVSEGQKTEVANIEQYVINKSTNNPRQALSKVTGITIWESDGGGLQLDVGGRGLDPRRSTNFNTRQNGYDISADALGYPESYYTPPLFVVSKIEFVRGAGALQYGTQFGGLLNFRFKKGPIDKKFSYATQNTFGAYKFMSTAHTFGGQVGKLNYLSFYQYKSGDSWRENSEFDAHNAHTSLTYEASKKLTLQLDYSMLYYLTKQAGGLSETQFDSDPQASNRDRNWFRVNWNIFAVKLHYQFNEKLNLYSNFFGLLGRRTSLGLLISPSEEDQGGYRDLIDGSFKNIGNETKLTYQYAFKKLENTLLIGTRAYRGFTNFSLGLGSKGSNSNFNALDFEENYTVDDYNQRRIKVSDYDFPNYNLSFFTENILRVNEKLSFVPGMRYEYIQTNSIGTFNDPFEVNDNLIFQEGGDTTQKVRHILLFGLGTSYKINENIEAYANITTNYRALNFTDVRVTGELQEVDSAIVDESGYSFDIGFRKRNFSKYYFDANFFHINYNDRIGEIREDDKRVRTNIGQAKIYGIESLVELNILKIMNPKAKDHKLILSLNGAYTIATYTNIDDTSTDGVESGNRVENVPKYNIRSGISYRYKSFGTSLQFSYMSAQFSDAQNTVENDFNNGVQGIIPSYQVLDFSAKYEFKRYVNLQFSLNNLTNTIYFTRRAAGYPGPGIIPAQGRTFFVTVGFKI